MASPAAKIAELEAALRSVERERDELATDVERLCLQSGSSMFDPTYLLTERLHSAENEVKQHRQQVSTLKDERDALIEKLQQARTGKALIEQCAAELSDRCKSLERDALFYKERAVKAMGERDQEFENMRAEGVRTQTLLGELRASLELALGDRKALEARLQLMQEALESVRKEQPAINDVAEAELLQLRDTVRHLEDTTQKLKAQLSDVQAEALHTHKLLKQAHKIEDQLTGQVRELQAELVAALRAQSYGGKEHPQAQATSPQSSPTGQISAPMSASGASPPEDLRLGTAGTRITELIPSHVSPATESPTRTGLVSPQPLLPGVVPFRAVALYGGQNPVRSLCTATAAAVTVSAAEAAAVLPSTSLGQTDAPLPPPPSLSVSGPQVPMHAAPVAVSLVVATAAVSDVETSAHEAAPPEKVDEDGEADTTGIEVQRPVESAPVTDGLLVDEVRQLEGALAQTRDELAQERAVHEDEREQLQLLRIMVHDFKIKLAQATQEKVEALMRAAQLTQAVTDAKQQTQQGLQGPFQVLQRQTSISSEHSSRDLSRSPGASSRGLLPATSSPTPAAGRSGGGGVGSQLSTKSLWTTWMGGSGGGWHYGSSSATISNIGAAQPPPSTSLQSAGVGHYATGGGGSQYPASVASEEGFEVEGVGCRTATVEAAAAAHAATVEAAEGRSRRLAVQLERVRSQLAMVDRLASEVGRCGSRLRKCGALLWSSREEDAPRRWTALGDLTRLAEECATLRTAAGLPSPFQQQQQQGEVAKMTAVAAAASPAGLWALASDLPPVVPLGFGEGPVLSACSAAGGSAAPTAAAGEYDSSVVCTREAGGVQRRVAEVLLGILEFGVRSLELYNHQSAMSSVLYS